MSWSRNGKGCFLPRGLMLSSRLGSALRAYLPALIVYVFSQWLPCKWGLEKTEGQMVVARAFLVQESRKQTPLEATTGEPGLPPAHLDREGCGGFPKAGRQAPSAPRTRALLGYHCDLHLEVMWDREQRACWCVWPMHTARCKFKADKMAQDFQRLLLSPRMNRDKPRLK